MPAENSKSPKKGNRKRGVYPRFLQFFPGLPRAERDGLPWSEKTASGGRVARPAPTARCSGWVGYAGAQQGSSHAGGCGSYGVAAVRIRKLESIAL